MDQNAAIAFGTAVLVSACVIIIIALAIGILFLLTLQRALNHCARRNRTMEPGMVWLNLIPIFHFYWGFHTVINVGDSLKREFADRDMDYGGDYGKTLGIWTMALSIANTVISNAVQLARSQAGSLLSLPIGIASLVLFIIYWVRIAGYNKQLDEDNLRGGDRDDRYDRDDDDRPRRPQRGPASTDIKSKERDDRFT